MAKNLLVLATVALSLSVGTGWAQTSLGHGQSGCLVHELHCESETVLYKGDCSTWTVEKITVGATGN